MADFTDRTAKALGPAVMDKLRTLRFCVVGCGGTGANFAEMLVRSGATHVTLIDGDTVDESNLNRVSSFAWYDVESPKVVALRARLDAIRPARRTRKPAPRVAPLGRAHGGGLAAGAHGRLATRQRAGLVQEADERCRNGQSAPPMRTTLRWRRACRDGGTLAAQLRPHAHRNANQLLRMGPCIAAIPGAHPIRARGWREGTCTHVPPYPAPRESRRGRSLSASSPVIVNEES